MCCKFKSSTRNKCGPNSYSCRKNDHPCITAYGESQRVGCYNINEKGKHIKNMLQTETYLKHYVTGN